MTRRPRIITETVTFLRELAEIIRNGNAHVGEAETAEKLTTRLDAYDARETKKDPSKRKAKRAKR